MVQVPEAVRPFVDFLAKYHFWLLVPLVPLIVLPLLLLTNGRLAAEMTAAKGQIDSRLSALKSVEAVQPHPNERWKGDMTRRVTRVQRETLAEWESFWASQAFLRQWPAELGPDFLQRAQALKPEGKLPRPLLERYQNGIRAIVRKLPARMGADEMMPDPASAGGGFGPGMAGAPGFAGGGEYSPYSPDASQGMGLGMGMMAGMPGAGPAAARGRKAATVQWSPADQQRLFTSFFWEEPPSTKKVVLAQEEINVYGLLCDVIARINKGAGGSYDAPISTVERLAVGYPAVDGSPEKTTAGRMQSPRGRGGAGGAGGDMYGGMGGMGSMGGPMGSSGSPMGGGEGADAGGGGEVKPSHPRFQGQAGGFGPGAYGMGSMVGISDDSGGGAPAAPANTDDSLQEWIYVDGDGKPLTAEQVKSASGQVASLMPFLLRGIADQRKLDAILIELARADVPITVREIRINPSASLAGAGGMYGGGPAGASSPYSPDAGGGAGYGMAGPMMGMGGPGAGGMGRPNDVTFEIAGTVAIARRPDPKALGIEEEAAEPGAAEPAAAEPEPAPPPADPVAPSDPAAVPAAAPAAADPNAAPADPNAAPAPAAAEPPPPPPNAAAAPRRSIRDPGPNSVVKQQIHVTTGAWSDCRRMAT
ncbi:MAG: hypothetical protein FJ309_05150 [Planctomycetes bacterium]|nr:hypothetical protein [Planctomycetota bacterium]MBM4057034.1 hypothetical protein [Planctomycetota bacterium]